LWSSEVLAGRAGFKSDSCRQRRRRQVVNVAGELEFRVAE